MLTAEVRHGRDGYRLHVIEAPAWALAVESAADAACARLGHPLCSGLLGRRLGHWLLHPAPGRRRERWSTSLTDEVARSAFPGSVVDV